MGHVSIVFGNIVGTPWKTEDYHKLQRLNKKIIDELPDNDKDFPWLTRNMFSAPDPDIDRIYRDQVIVFGASYKEVENEWNLWLIKFEEILKQLYWSSAIVYLEPELVGAHKYEWTFDIDQQDNWTSEHPKPTTSWICSGGPRKF